MPAGLLAQVQGWDAGRSESLVGLSCHNLLGYSPSRDRKAGGRGSMEG